MTNDAKNSWLNFDRFLEHLHKPTYMLFMVEVDLVACNQNVNVPYNFLFIDNIIFQLIKTKTISHLVARKKKTGLWQQQKVQDIEKTDRQNTSNEVLIDFLGCGLLKKRTHLKSKDIFVFAMMQYLMIEH